MVFFLSFFVVKEKQSPSLKSGLCGLFCQQQKSHKKRRFFISYHTKQPASFTLDPRHFCFWSFAFAFTPRREWKNSQLSFIWRYQLLYFISWFYAHCAFPDLNENYIMSAKLFLLCLLDDNRLTKKDQRLYFAISHVVIVDAILVPANTVELL